MTTFIQPFIFRCLGQLLATAALAGMVTIVLVNLLLFPDCNRVNRHCFLIHHAWSQSDAAV